MNVHPQLFDPPLEFAEGLIRVIGGQTTFFDRPFFVRYSEPQRKTRPVPYYAVDVKIDCLVVSFKILRLDGRIPFFHGFNFQGDLFPALLFHTVSTFVPAMGQKFQFTFHFPVVFQPVS